MMSYASMPRDPYADLLRPTPPRDRRRHPLDPSEPYVTRFTTAPVRQNPRTGSYDYRHGLLNDGSMTAKQRQFEEYVNEQQARRDEISDLKEWRRLKDLEEEAIALYHDIGENLEKYTTQMRTRDQMEMELQCGRNKQIEKDLSVNAQRALAAARSIPYAMEQERIRATKARVQADFKAGVEASMANTKIITNTTESQQASQKSELTQSKPKKHHNTSQPVSPTEAASPRQQQEKPKPSPAEICDQLQGQAPNQSQSPSATIGQPTCSGTSVRIGSSKQQEEKNQPSTEEVRRQFVEQGRKKAAEAGLSRHKEPKNELSSEGVCSKAQARMRAQPAALNRTPTTTKIVRTVPPQSADYTPMRRFWEGDIFLGPRPKAADFQRMRIYAGVHYPKGGVLVRKEPGLTKLHLGRSSKEEQSLAHNTYQSPDTSRENRVIRSTEHSPKSTSRHQASNSTSPDKSSDSTSPEKSSGSTSPEKSSKSTSAHQAPDAKNKPPSPAVPSPPKTPVPQIVPVYDPLDNSSRLPRFEWVQYRNVRSNIQGNKWRPSMYRDPFINAMFCEKMEDLRKDGLAKKQKLEERQRLRKSKCSQGGTSQQEEIELERKKKLACNQKWKELDEMCRKTCRKGKMSQQKSMSSQEFDELCRKMCSQGETSQQQEGRSSQEGSSQHEGNPDLGTNKGSSQEDATSQQEESSQKSNLESDLKRRLDQLC